MIAYGSNKLTRRTVLAGGAASAAAGYWARPAGAVLSIDVTQGNIQPIPIAIPDFVGGSSNDGDVACVGRERRGDLDAPGRAVDEHAIGRGAHQIFRRSTTRPLTMCSSMISSMSSRSTYVYQVPSG